MIMQRPWPPDLWIKVNDWTPLTGFKEQWWEVKFASALVARFATEELAIQYRDWAWSRARYRELLGARYLGWGVPKGANPYPGWGRVDGDPT